MLKKITGQITDTFRSYPGKFWVLMGAAFIDNLGSSFLYPFFALYTTDKFGVGMTEVGKMFAVFALANLVGSLVSGVMIDKLGRKFMIVFGLLASALSSLMLGFVNQLSVFYIAVGLVGLFGMAGEPAQQVMVADLLPEEKHTEGYGLWRVAFNLAMTFGPMLGGLMAMHSYLLLFILDACFSLITALVVLIALPNTQPAPDADAQTGTDEDTNGGYGVVLRDGVFLLYVVAVILLSLVYVQLSSTLPVYLQENHQITAEHYGYMLGLNAGTIVLMQLWLAKKVSGFRLLRLMGIGAVFYTVGFALFGLVSGLIWFFVTIIVITIGEMVIDPVAQTLVMRFAPKNMRGRYLSIYGMSWLIPYAGGPYLAGLILDNYDPEMVWYLAGGLALFAGLIFIWLDYLTRRRFGEEAAKEFPVLDDLVVADDV